MAITAIMAVASFCHSVMVNRTRASKKELDDLRGTDAKLLETLNAASETLRKYIDAEAEMLRTGLIAHTERLTAIETRVEHLPNTAAIDKITESMSSLRGDFRELLGEFRGIREQVIKIDGFLRHDRV